MSEPEILSISADVASILGLAISVVVWAQVGAIKATVLSRARIPEMIRDLERNAEALRGTFKDWPEHEKEAEGVTQRLDGILLNSLQKLAGADKKKLSQPHNLIKKRSSLLTWLRPNTVEQRLDAMWDIHNALLGAIEVLQQRNKDNKKRV
jgi:hypothetical protein